MKTIADDIEKSVLESIPLIRSVGMEEFERKPSPQKWSKKEIVGHLVDSAQNNIQRFIRAQYEHSPRIVYAQDDWVKLTGYETYDSDDLVQLWALLNMHVCFILRKMDPANYEKHCDVGEVHTLKFIAEDYLRHLKHHLKQITT